MSVVAGEMRRAAGPGRRGAHPDGDTLGGRGPDPRREPPVGRDGRRPDAASAG